MKFVVNVIPVSDLERDPIFTLEKEVCMEFIYPDVAYNQFLIHSEKRNGTFVLQLRKYNSIVKEESFSNWHEYSQRYDMVRTMLKTRAQFGY